MKRVSLPLTLVTLIFIGLTLAVSTGSPRVLATKKVAVAPPPQPTTLKVEQSRNHLTENHRTSREDHFEVENMPPALRRHFEKLMQTIPGAGGDHE